MKREETITMSGEEFDNMYAKVYSIYDSIVNGEGRVIVELFADVARTALEVLEMMDSED